MGADDEDLEPGGGGPESIGAFFQSGRAGGVTFRGKDMGPDPPDGAGPAQISEQIRATDYREAAKTAGGGWG